MTKFLLIDTTLKGAAVGVAGFTEGDPSSVTLTTAAFHFDNYGSAAALSRLVHGVLEASQCPLRDIGRIVVGNGPGSFTGIKVGLAYVAGLRRAKEPLIPTMGVSSLVALATGARDEKVAWLLPSTRTHGYLAIGDGKGQAEVYIVDASGSALILLEENARREVDAGVIDGTKISLALPWKAVEQHLETMGQQWQAPDFPTVASLALSAMAVRAAREWQTLSNSQEMPEPRYVRRSAPEERLISKGK